MAQSAPGTVKGYKTLCRHKHKRPAWITRPRRFEYSGLKFKNVAHSDYSCRASGFQECVFVVFRRRRRIICQRGRNEVTKPLMRLLRIGQFALQVEPLYRLDTARSAKNNQIQRLTR